VSGRMSSNTHSSIVERQTPGDRHRVVEIDIGLFAFEGGLGESFFSSKLSASYGGTGESSSGPVLLGGSGDFRGSGERFAMLFSSEEVTSLILSSFDIFPSIVGDESAVTYGMNSTSLAMEMYSVSNPVTLIISPMSDAGGGAV
jgi:hypothetical protein